MERVFKKGLEKLFGKLAEAELIEPLGELLVKLASFLDVDSRPEFKVKLMPVSATDFSTGKKERWTCIGFRTVEPDEHELLRKQIKKELEEERNNHDQS